MRPSFVAKDRGSVRDLQDSMTLQSVRSVMYLRELRSDGFDFGNNGKRVNSARDHAILETLIADLRQNGFADDRVHTIPASAILAFLGPTGRLREVREALDRLSMSSFRLPGHRAFSPVMAWREVGTDIQVELAGPLRSAIATPTGIEFPYRHLDLRGIWTFTSGYSAPVFRYLLASSPTPTGAPQSFRLQLDWDELAEIVNLRRQKSGSWRWQISQSVLKPLVRDFNRIDPTELTIEVHHLDGDKYSPDIIFKCHRPLAPLQRIRTVRLMPFSRGDRASTNAFSLPYDSRLVIDRPDAAPYKVSLSAWAKIASLLKLSESRLIEFSQAFDYAIDELHNLDDPRYGHLTPSAAIRSHRRERLLETIKEVGADRAAALFAFEEAAEPDLTDPVVQYRLFLDGTKGFANRDRRERRRIEKLKRRRKAAEGERSHLHRTGSQTEASIRSPKKATSPEPRRVARYANMSDEDLAREVEEFSCRRAAALAEEDRLAASRAAAKAEKQERQRVARNARRRERYASLKADRGDQLY